MADKSRPSIVEALRAIDEEERRVNDHEVDGGEDAMAGIERGIADVVQRDNHLQNLSFVSRELVDKAALFNERHAVYGDNYFRFGPLVKVLLGNQVLDPTDAHAMARLGLLVQIMSKLTRYCENFNRGGHDDSLDDLAVYAMMLKQVDTEGMK